MLEHQIRVLYTGNQKIEGQRRTNGSVSLDDILENIVQDIESQTNVDS